MSQNLLQDQWTAVDRYFGDSLIPSDAILESVIQASIDAGLPPANVAPNQGKLLMLLAQIQKARCILEIGTLGGYSTIWLARALPPGGRLVTLEVDPKHAEVARANFARLGLSDVIDLRLGRAVDTLPQVAADKIGPFDLIFIDADKQSNAEYLAWALKLSRLGSVIIVDNVVRGSAVVDAQSQDPSVQGVRRVTDMIAAEPRPSATALQTVGSKGYDGFALAVVIAE